MAGHAGDDDARRMKERPETRQDILVRERLTHRVGRHPGRIRRELDERIHRHGPPLTHDEWIQVDAADVRPLPGEPPQAHQHIGQCGPVHRGLTPKGLREEPMGRETIHHAFGLGMRERQGGEDRIPQRLGENAAQPQQHTGAELRIAHHAGDQLATPAHHRRHEQIDLAVLRARTPQQILRGRRYGVVIGQANTHQIPLGLVSDAVTAQLQYDRVADGTSRLDGALAVRSDTFLGKGDAVGTQQILRSRLGEGRAGGLAHGGAA